MGVAFIYIEINADKSAAMWDDLWGKWLIGAGNWVAGGLKLSFFSIDALPPKP